MKYPFETIRATLLARSEHYLRLWFPLGKVRGTEFVLGNIQGDAGDSLKISLVKGIGKDFATGQTYIVFAKKTETNGVFRQLWPSHTSIEDQGVLLCPNDKPVTAKSVKDIF